jgi:hypothetical protein
MRVAGAGSVAYVDHDHMSVRASRLHLSTAAPPRARLIVRPIYILIQCDRVASCTIDVRTSSGIDPRPDFCARPRETRST